MEIILLLLIQAFWFIAPAYAANAFPPLMKGKTSIDGKRVFRGNRLLGDGKTVEGFWGGIIFGVFIGSVQIYGQQFLPEIGLVEMTFPIVFLLAFGTMAGDLIGSFIKRRMGMKRGESALIMDQLGFLILAIAFAAPYYAPTFPMLVLLVIFTPIIHWVANVFGYWIKVKRQPW
jgi:CDP-2,3-bis-(O-geranylgeranyl)-sn-glycerol synthase